jgi:hypothetical protein
MSDKCSKEQNIQSDEELDLDIEDSGDTIKNKEEIDCET